MQAWFNSPSPDAAQGWSAWNAEAWQAPGDPAGKQQGRLAAALRAVALRLPSLLLILGATARMKPVSDSALTGRKQEGQQRLPKYLLALIMAGGCLEELGAGHSRLPIYPNAHFLPPCIV